MARLLKTRVFDPAKLKLCNLKALSAEALKSHCPKCPQSYKSIRVQALLA